MTDLAHLRSCQSLIELTGKMFFELLKYRHVVNTAMEDEIVSEMLMKITGGKASGALKEHVGDLGISYKVLGSDIIDNKDVLNLLPTDNTFEKYDPKNLEKFIQITATKKSILNVIFEIC